MNRRSLLGTQAVLFVVVLAAVACDPDRVTHFYEEHFEGICYTDGGVEPFCGWERSSGEPGQATLVETVHPGEHALQLTGNVTVRGPGSNAISSGGNLVLRIAVRCDLGSTLMSDVVVNDTTGSRTFSNSLIASPEWAETCGFLGRGSLSNARIVAFVFTKTGSGSCEMSDIVVDEDIFGGGC